MPPIPPIAQERTMSKPAAHDSHDQPQDVIESIVPMMPMVLPVAGAVLIFLLAFIAVFMA
jgi:hypothetical protein